MVGSDGRGKLLGRYGELAWVWRDNGYGTVRLDTLRPLDAPAPESEGERLRAAAADLIGHAKWVAANFDVHFAGLADCEKALASTAPTPATGLCPAGVAPAPDKGKAFDVRAYVEVERMRARAERLAVALRRADDDLASMDAPRGPGTTRCAIAAALASTTPTCPPGHIMIGDRAATEMAQAIIRADQFITNGVKHGFIRMPDATTPDPAHETPKIVRSARAHAEAIIALSAGEGV